MKIVVTGGRSYGVIPDWTSKPAPHRYLKYEDPQTGVQEWIEEENPAYIELCRKRGDERRILERVLDSWLENFCEPCSLELAQGGASGADALARRWAADRHVPCTTFEAYWDTLGKSAGPERNHRMLEQFKPDFLIAFPGGRGTAHCIQAAKLRRIPVIKVVGS